MIRGKTAASRCTRRLIRKYGVVIDCRDGSGSLTSNRSVSGGVIKYRLVLGTHTGVLVLLSLLVLADIIHSESLTL